MVTETAIVSDLPSCSKVHPQTKCKYVTDINDDSIIDAKEFHKLQTLYLQLMTHIRNIDRKMKVQTEENFQKTIMDEIVNLKKALELK